MSTAIPLPGESHSLSFGLLACSSAAAESHQGDCQSTSPDSATTVPASTPSAPERSAGKLRPLAKVVNNRIALVREQQGISQRTMARRMGVDLKSYQALENPSADLRLSELMALRQALDVPMVDLLEDTQELSRPVAERAKMIKVMKTAVALRDTPGNPRQQRMVATLCEQLCDVMPELAEVSGWPQFGSRRGKSALGKALSQPICTADLGLPD